MSTSTLPKGARKIRTVPIGPYRVPVYRVTPGMVPDMGDDLGQCDHEHIRIYVRTGQSEAQEKDTIMHECVHMFLLVTGLRHMLEASVKVPDFAAFEETFVRVATPHLVGYLK